MTADLAGRERQAVLLELLESLQLGRHAIAAERQAAARDTRPLALVTTTRVSPVSMLVTVTVTPGSAAPD